MNLVAAIIFWAIIPLKNYTNYSLIQDFYIGDSLIYLATNGGVIEFSDVVMYNDSAVYKGFRIYGSASGLPHNIVLSVYAAKDTVWAVPVNSGLYYKLPDASDFYQYFIPYGGIKGARKIRKYKDLLFLQLEKSILRIKLNNNLNPDDDNISIVVSDSTQVFEVFEDSLYYSKNDTLFVQYVMSSFPEDTIIYTANLTAVWKGRYLVVGTESGIYVKNDTSTEHYVSGEVYRLFVEGDTVFAACSDGAFLIHSGTMEKIDGKSHALFKYRGLVFTNKISTPSNTYYNGGLYVLSDTGFLPLSSGIPTNFITSMDTDGKNLYAGTLDWGDKPRFLPSKAFFVSLDDGVVHFIDSIGNSTSDAIRIVKTGNGKVFFGAYSIDSKGLFVYDNGVVQHITHFPSLLFTDLVVSKDTFIALWGDGVYRWSGNSTTLVYNVNYPSWIAIDSNKRVWIGTEASGVIVTDTQGNVLRAINYELPSPAITAILRVGDVMAVGTDGGLVLFEGDFIPHGVLLGRRIRSLAVDRFSRLYALTDSTLYFINTANYSAKILLSSPPIVPIQAADWEVRNVLTVDSDLNMYIGSKEGILVVKLDEPEYGIGSIRVFPNPVRKGDKITLCASSPFAVLTLSGKKIADFDGGCHLLSSKNLSPGLYLVLTYDGERSRFIIRGKK